MRLFLDANILFSAAISPGGRARALFELTAAGEHSLLASPHAIAEAERNLQLKYPENLGTFHTLSRQLSITPEATPDAARWARERGLPAEDAPILAAAVQAQAELLVTGDRTHFGHLYGKTLRGVQVVPPADALARVLGSR